MSLSKYIPFIFLFCTPTFIKAETIVLKADRWCPFNCETTEKNKKENGYMIDVARIIFERKGHNVVYQIESWADSIKSVRKGDATGLVATTKADAPDFIYPDKSMGSSKECFYVKASDKWDFVDIDNLKNRKIGIVESYAYSGEITGFMFEHQGLFVKAAGPTPLDMNLENLNKGVIDTIIENPFVFNYHTEKKKLRDHYADAGCTIGDDLYIGFSPNNPRSKEFAKMLNEGILELKKDGTLDKIIAKYSLKDWSP